MPACSCQSTNNLVDLIGNELMILFHATELDKGQVVDGNLKVTCSAKVAGDKRADSARMIIFPGFPHDLAPQCMKV